MSELRLFFETVNIPELGTWHTVTATARKCHEWHDFILHTKWKRFVRHHPTKAMFIGARTVYDGINPAEDFGDFVTRHFEHRQSHTVWLFVKHPRVNPFYVFPADVRLEADQRRAEQGGAK